MTSFLALPEMKLLGIMVYCEIHLHKHKPCVLMLPGQKQPAEVFTAKTRSSQCRLPVDSVSTDGDCPSSQVARTCHMHAAMATHEGPFRDQELYRHDLRPFDSSLLFLIALALAALQTRDTMTNRTSGLSQHALL